MMELIGKKIWIMRDTQGPDNGFEGRVERVNNKWIYIAIDDPSGGVAGAWINTDLQREIQVLND
ncbi:MAG TPA: hypothetical protein VK464_02275 [Symbiobacteriaceae bacterium]|nr:hypothetical protein [Symbiobacteriaceae bacterium]